MVEIEVARLQHTHDLCAHDGLAVEGYAAGRNNLLNEFGVDVHVGLQIACLYEVVQPIENGVDAKERLLHERVVVVVLGILLGNGLQHIAYPAVGVGGIECLDLEQHFGLRDVAHEVVALQHVDPFLAKRVVGFAVAHGAQADEQLHKCGRRCLRKWEPRGDVYIFHAFRNGVDNILEQGFVGQDDSGFASIGNAIVFAEPLVDVLRLDIFCSRTDKCNRFWLIECVVNGLVVAIERIGKVFQVLADECACFIF